MNDTLHTRILAMAAAALGVAACGGATPQSPPASPSAAAPTAVEVPQATTSAPSDSHASCGAKGQASCGAKGGATETKAAASCGAKTADDPKDVKDSKTVDAVASQPVAPAPAVPSSAKPAPAKTPPKKNGAPHETSCGAGSCAAKK